MVFKKLEKKMWKKEVEKSLRKEKIKLNKN